MTHISLMYSAPTYSSSQVRYEVLASTRLSPVCYSFESKSNIIAYMTPTNTQAKTSYSIPSRHQKAPLEIQYPTHASASSSPIACIFAIVVLTLRTFPVLKLVIPAASVLPTPRLRIASSPLANARKNSSNLMAGYTYSSRQ